MSKLDLTRKITPNLDRHLVLKLLEMMEEAKIYPESAILKAKYSALKGTFRVVREKECWARLYPEEAKGESKMASALAEKESKLIAKAEEWKNNDRLKLFADDEEIEKLEEAENFFFEHLSKNFGFTLEDLGLLYEYAQFRFKCGDYVEAAELLYYYRELDENQKIKAIWGKFAAEILVEEWSNALLDFHTLKKTLEDIPTEGTSPIVSLQQRNWLMHWSLFVFFNHPSGCDELVEFFLGEGYLNVIQTGSQHLLRYLTVALVVNKPKREGQVKDLVRVIEAEVYKYSDPITNFLKALFSDFDFDAAKAVLKECEEVFATDVFIHKFKDKFMENARLFIFENFCKIHSRISLSTLAKQLDMDDKEAEKWIVNLIRNAQLEAKVDSSQKRIVVDTSFPTIWAKVQKKTATVALRTTSLVDTLSQLKHKEEEEEY